jgi:hypothetical protein
VGDFLARPRLPKLPAAKPHLTDQRTFVQSLLLA